MRSRVESELEVEVRRAKEEMVFGMLLELCVASRRLWLWMSGM